MHPSLNKNLYFVKEHVKIFKAASSFDVLDPETRELILNCSEANLGFFTKMFRFTDYKRMTPFNMEIKTPNGETILTVRRGVSFFLSTVEVLDAQNRLISDKEMFRGTLTQTAVYPREVVKSALRCNAASVIFSHNIRVVWRNRPGRMNC